ncbi:cell division protein ZipA [Agarivorans sp. Z349TD_8]|uniref:cell division protein ZipA n=1 Tax=Agarivorans sp. Z349TD_8 TaxID=3421434 RepID=UPI003D7D3C48
MQELRIVLIVVGVILIVALLAHGFWSSRKQRPEKLLSPKVSASKAPISTRDDSGFDDLGVGQARVIGDPIDDAISNLDAAEKPVLHPSSVEPELEPEAEREQRKEPAFHFSAVDSAPEVSDVQGLDGLVKTVKTEAEASLSTVDVESAPEVEPTFVYDMDEDNEPEPQPKTEPTQDPNAPDDVFILNIMAQSGRYLKGPALLASLDKIGLRYGDMDIFHRHLDNRGSGPIIFSLANMLNPGTFDLDKIEQLETRGVTLFMTVPCKGEPTKNFALMHNAATSLAKDLDAIILDDQRNPLTRQTVNHYEQRVREYERKQLLVN